MPLTFVMVAKYKDNITNHALKQLCLLYPNSTVYVVCPSDDIDIIQALRLNNVVCIDENTFITGVDFKSFAEMVNGFDQLGKVTWYWQQFLKLMSAFSHQLPDEYVIIDSDIILLKKIPFKTNGRYIFNNSLFENEVRYYNNFTRHALGMAPDAKLHKNTVSEYMIVDKTHLQNLMKTFGRDTNAMITGVLSILNEKRRYINSKEFKQKARLIDKYNLHHGCDLSEYDLYINYMLLHYPEQCTRQTLYYYRLSHFHYGDAILPHQIRIFKDIWDLDAISVESWTSRPTIKIHVALCKGVAYLRKICNYYGRLPLSPKPKNDPKWVYDRPIVFMGPAIKMYKRKTRYWILEKLNLLPKWAKDEN